MPRQTLKKPVTSPQTTDDVHVRRVVEAVRELNTLIDEGRKVGLIIDVFSAFVDETTSEYPKSVVKANILKIMVRE